MPQTSAQEYRRLQLTNAADFSSRVPQTSTNGCHIFQQLLTEIKTEIFTLISQHRSQKINVHCPTQDYMDYINNGKQILIDFGLTNCYIMLPSFFGKSKSSNSEFHRVERNKTTSLGWTLCRQDISISWVVCLGAGQSVKDSRIHFLASRFERRNTGGIDSA